MRGNSRMRSAAEPMRARPQQMVREHPLESALVVFGLGVGIGVVIGTALAGSLREFREPAPSAAQRIGRQVLEAVSQSLPEAVARHLPRF